MTRVAVLAGGILDCLPAEADVYVGVDAGCVALLEQGYPLDMAVGDFDSVTEKDYATIQQAAGIFHQAPAEKDDTDLELALKLIFQTIPEAQVTVYGALGGRMDHTLTNLFLASEPALAPFMERIELCSLDNHILFRPVGRHRLTQRLGMTYISFMPSDQTRLQIRGAKYPLHADNYFFKKCYASNEFIMEAIEIDVDQGYVVVIYSKDRK